MFGFAVHQYIVSDNLAESIIAHFGILDKSNHNKKVSNWFRYNPADAQ